MSAASAEPDLRRLLSDQGRDVVLELHGSTLVETTPARRRPSLHRSALHALVALHRRANALVAAGMVEDTGAGRGAVSVLATTLALPLARAEVERRLGEHVDAGGARALAEAVPLLLLDWPVGFRFAALYEKAPRDRAAARAIAEALGALGASEVGSAGELFRVALVQRNRDALDAALALLPAVRSFDTWIDVLELVDDVGERRHARVLQALSKGRVPADAKDPLRELARDLARR